VNELVEAADAKQLNKTIARYGRVDLLCIDLCRVRDYAEKGVRERDAGWAEAVVLGIVDGGEDLSGPGIRPLLEDGELARLVGGP
jgi:hypothetical protein